MPPTDSFDEQLEEELQNLRQEGRFRACPPFDGTPDAPELNQHPVLNFCSNDYLGFSRHPVLLAASTNAIQRHGSGATASRLVCGDLPPHRSLEQAVAHLLGTEAALSFPSGYQANLAAITAFAGPDDLIVSDAANHASLIDGCRLSRSKVSVFPHKDVATARSALQQPGTFRRRFLVTESLFSMDGDFAPLADLRALANETNARLIVDDAHAIGIFGPNGAGLCNAHRVRPDIHVGTFGKAVGSAGGFVAGSRSVIETLVNRGRTFIFTTGSPPGVAAASTAGIRLLAEDTGESARKRLFDNLKHLREALGRPQSETLSPIVPIVFGENGAALNASRRLLDAGIFVQAIRPPTVPPGTARLRLTLSAAHDFAAIEALVSQLKPLLSGLHS
ncbi:MAG: pyridoxal phosphate-dependent aminotransferase family protein [Deltaproteobacteria bacterium]|nr:pyridoxal phosphate-dependent aminotransferase family protein [Deltaproteobacteria bacterium]